MSTEQLTIRRLIVLAVLLIILTGIEYLQLIGAVHVPEWVAGILLLSYGSFAAYVLIATLMIRD